MSTLPIDDLELHYEVHGQGAPLFLLHGFLGGGVDWTPFLDGFAAGHQLIVPDLRGHGRSFNVSGNVSGNISGNVSGNASGDPSGNPSGRFTHRRCAEDILALADALGFERFSAVGMSAGGNAMLHAATMAPARVAAMVLVSATTHFPQIGRAHV